MGTWIVRSVSGAALAAATGEDRIQGRRLRSSRRTGKPGTGRRRARNRQAVVTEEASVDSDDRADEAGLLSM